jgi:zinc/manganese transport system ATP-binding protein
MTAAAPAGRALRVDDLTVGYRRRPAVHHVSLAAEAGALVAIVGPNGAGKSTLLRCLAGQLAPMSGEVQRTTDVAYMPQQSSLDRSFPISVRDLVAAGFWRRTGFLRGLDAAGRARIEEALEAVGLSGFGDRLIATLSGGQLQRVLFARAMAQDARLILLDEPFSGVDSRTAARLMELLLGWGQEGRIVCAALHDLDQVRAHFPTTLILARHQIAFGATADVLTGANLLEARRMSESWRENAEICAGETPRRERKP